MNEAADCAVIEAIAQDYDVSLKLLFRRSNGVAIQRLLGERVIEWLNVELPRVRNPRVDMLARMESGVLTHLDLQSGNDPEMGRREAEYYLDLHRLDGRACAAGGALCRA